MGFITSQFDYVLGKNLATMQDLSIAGDTKNYTVGSKVIDKGVYEITFSYSVRKADTTATANPHFYIGFGSRTSDTSGSYTDKTLVRLGADNPAAQSYPVQGAITVWVTKTTDDEIHFMCSEISSTSNWWMYNINACARKIADI